jgi:hypothetical protein
MEQRTLGGISPFTRMGGQGGGVAGCIPYTDEPRGLCRRRGLGSDREQRQIAPGCAGRQGANTIGAGGKDRLYIIQRERGTGMKFDPEQRRQERLMPHCGQPLGDFRAILGRAGDKNLHLLSRIYCRFGAAGLEEGL